MPRYYNTKTGNCEIWSVPPQGDEYISFEEYSKQRNSECAEKIDKAEVLRELKRLKKDLIKSEANTLIKDGTVIISKYGFKIQTGESSMSKLDSRLYCLTTKGIDSTSFRDAENNMHEITVEDMKEIVTEIADFCNSVMDAKWSVDDEIEQATTEEELDAINLSDHWRIRRYSFGE